MNTPKPVILSLTKMHEAGLGLLREAGNLKMSSGWDQATICREIPGADALVIRTQGEINAAVMDAAGPSLKVIGRHGVGFDHVDIDAATERGIQVVYTPGANLESVAEHAISMMIALSKFFMPSIEALKQGDYFARTKWMGRDIKGRSLGIIGFGRIGKRLGEIAYQAFDMKVQYTDIMDMPKHATERAGGAQRVDLDTLLATSEFISLHVPLDSSTRKLINRETLAKIRPDCILLNTCRGPVVDELAVAEALDESRLFGYGADVYEVEPPPVPGHPLIGRTDNVILTPHNAAQTEESLINMAQWMAEDVLRVLKGQQPRYPVNNPQAVAAARLKLGL
ncbi:MAG: hydroxyacid dehydrogenase [Planctomycetota bacterium]|nr:hydroxyacid dehydrogenase [Planctomycetota bacterium]